MTTSTRTSSNKTALRASLKKEDDSLADRLAGTDVPLVATSETETPDLGIPEGAVAAAPARRSASRAATKPAVGRPAAKAASADATSGSAAKAPTRTPRKAAAVTAKPATRRTATAVKPTKAATRQPGPVEQIEKVAKQKRDKLVRYSVKLLQSEEAAIDALRVELSNAAGWVATKSDIVRAGVQAFAQQKVEQMQKLLGSLAVPSKGKKGNKKKR